MFNSTDKDGISFSIRDGLYMPFIYKGHQVVVHNAAWSFREKIWVDDDLLVNRIGVSMTSTHELRVAGDALTVLLNLFFIGEGVTRLYSVAVRKELLGSVLGWTLTPLLERALASNRGEIAVRILRTCRRMGLSTVAVYSDADENAPHVLAADEAVTLGVAARRGEDGVDIRPLVHACDVPLGLLERHVARRSDHRAATRQLCRVGHHAGDAEVRQQNIAVLLDHDIGRLDVTVDHTLAVGIGQAIQHVE